MPTGDRAHRLVVGTARQLTVRLLSLAVGLVTGPVLARHLGPSRFGQLTLIFAIGSLAAVTIDAGMPTLVARRVPTLDSESRGPWLADVWHVRWVTAWASATVLAAVAWLLPLDHVLTWGLIILAAGIPVGSAAGVAAGTFLADLDPGRASVGEIVSRSTWLIAVGLLVLLDGGVIATVAASTLVGIAGGVSLLALRGRPPTRSIRGRVGGILREALVLGVLPLLGLVYSRSDTLVLAWLKGDAAVGLYGLEWRVMELLTGLTAVVSSLLLPKLSEQTAPALQRWEFRLGHQWLLLLFAPVAIAVAISAESVLRLFGGASYLAVGTGLLAPHWTLMLLMGAFVLMLPAMANGALMLALGMEDQLVRHFLVSIAVNLGLTLLLVPSLSYLGAAMSTIASEVFVVVYSTRALRRRLGPLRVGRQLMPLVAALTASTLVAGTVLILVGGPTAIVAQVTALVAGLATLVGATLHRRLAATVADMLDVLDPEEAGALWHAYRVLRDKVHERGGVPHASKKAVDVLLVPIEQLLGPAGYGRGQNERVIEIPWALSRYYGEERVLEVGYAFAEARYLEALRRLDVPDLHGFDQSPADFPWLRRHHGDIRDCPLPNGYFDLVLCISTIEHIGMDNERYGGESEHDRSGDHLALAEMARIVRPGGRIIVTVPFGRDEDRGWYRHYGYERWHALLRSVDCEVTSEAYFGYFASTGWVRVEPEQLAHVGYQERGATNAAGLACAELTRMPR